MTRIQFWNTLRKRIHRVSTLNILLSRVDCISSVASATEMNLGASDARHSPQFWMARRRIHLCALDRHTLLRKTWSRGRFLLYWWLETKEVPVARAMREGQRAESLAFSWSGGRICCSSNARQGVSYIANVLNPDFFVMISATEMPAAGAMCDSHFFSGCEARARLSIKDYSRSRCPSVSVGVFWCIGNTFWFIELCCILTSRNNSKCQKW